MLSQKQKKVSKQKKVITDIDVKRRAVKLVISHLKKKLSDNQNNKANIDLWIERVEELLAKEEFVIKDYIEVRKDLNDVIERTMDEETRFKLRDSWYSFGKALEKKVKRH